MVCVAGGNDGWVVDALEVELAPEVLGQLAAAGGGVGRLPFVFGERGVDLAVVVRLVDSRAGGEVGQLAQEDVELDGAAFDGNALDLSAPGGIGGVAEQAEGLAGIGVGDDDGRRRCVRRIRAGRPRRGGSAATGTPEMTVAPASRAASQK